MYAGECQGPGVRSDFEMVHLRKVPSQYNHLSGLLDIFKNKIGCPLTPLPPINIAIRFTYVLQDWQQCSWPQQPPDFDALLAGEVGGVEFGKLPFGACEDPISDLDPLQAPHWSVRVRKADNPQCLLGEFLMEFFKLCCRKETTEEILGRNSMEEEGKENSDITQALSKLTEPAAVPIHKLSVSSMVHSARKRIRRHRRVEESPLNNDVLNSILLYLFPDAALDKSDPSEVKSTQHSPGGKTEPDRESEDYHLYNQLKSAPSDSLTYRLALCICMVNFHHGGVRAVAHLWQEFVLEMRYRWENNCMIYGLASGAPDLRCCLLHQKLQVKLHCRDPHAFSDRSYGRSLRAAFILRHTSETCKSVAD
ncbi:rab3 GTPase-activating catalytic subunit [Labeo rohita]|uniref:Rab3 GTPase-activating catalytic subunit n=1 Tax=Labeo rohita TaxID=84645 RepID=A0A498M8R6_LABRO|nr:rab3 GTPase-activating catalytic subunit [Labeo rohita]